ncbi:hypothetical protein [Streptococcus sp. 27098_8_109]|jgi:hypothetical protein|uniref:hypothetical protein n=1 Tax=Streptococcus sp. 27098_8_109 TaxID=3003659 RepID=UPI00352F4A2D
MPMAVDLNELVEAAVEKASERIIELVYQSIQEAERRSSRRTHWAPIKEVQAETGWGRKKIEDFRDAGKFRYQQNAKGGKYLYDMNDVLRFQSQLAK